MNPYGSSRNERDWIDVMQACENGHIITSSAKLSPEYMKKRCPECGAATLTQCPSCRTDIQGFHHIAGVLHSGPDAPPAYCHHCGEAYPWTASGALSRANKTQKNDVQQTNNVFVVHGHDEQMKQHAARVLSKLKLTPVILHEQPNGGRTIIEKFEHNADVSFAVVLLSPDDMAYPANKDAKQAVPRARQNVVLELGYFVGRLGRSRVFTLKRGHTLEVPSDFSGVVYTDYDPAGRWELELAKELKAAGYAVDANNLI